VVKDEEGPEIFIFFYIYLQFFNVSSLPLPLSLDAAIAEDPDVRQLILELKGQYSSASEGGGVCMSEDKEEDDSMEDSFMPRARRMSVKRISTQAKEEMAKQSIEIEASMRRTSLAQYVS